MYETFITVATFSAQVEKTYDRNEIDCLSCISHSGHTNALSIFPLTMKPVHHDTRETSDEGTKYKQDYE